MDKVYSVNPQIGECKHSVSYHDGVQTHSDGSPFFDLRILRTKKQVTDFVKELRADGYRERCWND